VRIVRPRLRNADPVPRIYSGASGLLARAIDSVVGFVAPGTANQMRRRRMESAAMLAFEAATVDRTMPMESAQSADAEVLPNLHTMRARSRRHVQDDSHADSAVHVYVDAVVGPGIRPQCSATIDSTGATQQQVDDWRRQCEGYFETWSNSMADSSGHGTFYDLQQLVARTRKVDGECFTHTVIGGDQTLSIEVIDADRVGNPQGTLDGINLRSGVVVDAKMRPVGYHVSTTHPADVAFLTAANYVLVPARDGDLSVVQHHYRRNRPGQTRGYPDSASAQQYLEHLHHYLKSEIIGARAAANYAMFIKKAVSASDQEIMSVVDSIDGQNETVYHERLEAGTIAYLNEGEEPVAFNPNRPGAGDSFVMRMLRAVAASHGMSYERMARDYGGMNYSSMRGLLKEEQRGFDRDRALLVRQFCVPVWKNVIRHGIQTGAIQPPPQYLDQPDVWLESHWIPPAMGWVDPHKEIAAAQEAINANLSTHWHEAGRAGLDPIDVLERKADYYKKAAQIEADNGLPAGTLTGAAVSVDSGSGNESPDTNATTGEDAAAPISPESVAEPVDRKALLDAYGAAVRAGLLSPSQEVESALRQLLDLPPISAAVAENWNNEPVRRPVTLSNVNSTAINEDEASDDASDFAPPDEPDEPDEPEAAAEEEEDDLTEEEQQAVEQQSAEMFQPPAGAKNNAKKVLRWREEHGNEVKGMTAVGWRRASQLASGAKVSADIVKRMAAFNRHRKNAAVAPEFKDTPWKDAGYVAWLGWGGTTGINWALRVSKRLQETN
jgi:lambda family phage portal protein